MVWKYIVEECLCQKITIAYKEFYFPLMKELLNQTTYIKILDGNFKVSTISM